MKMYRRVHLRKRQRLIDAQDPRPRKVRRNKAGVIVQTPPPKW